MEIISSKNNQRIKDIAALQKQKKARNESGLFVIEGLRIVRDALKTAPHLIEGILISKSFFDSGILDTDEYLSSVSEGIEVTVATDEAFAAACETMTPQGILAIVKKPHYELTDVLKTSPSKNGISLLILESVQDPGNLGTMFRTAEAAGMSGIIMSSDTVEVFNPKVTRSTMGSVFRVPFLYVDDLVQIIAELKERDITIYASYLHGGTDYNTVDYKQNCAVLVGNEGNGLSDEVVNSANHRIFIPMAGEVESLNAAVAAALLMYKC